MTVAEFNAVLARYPELKTGLPEHFDEVMRIAQRIIDHRASPPCPWAGRSDGERADAFDVAFPCVSRNGNPT